MKNFVLIAGLALVMASCSKEKSTSQIRITVVSPAGVPIQNTNVLLSVPIDNTAQFYGITDENGFIEFKSGLDAYFDLTVWKGLWKGCDFVRFRQGEQSEVRIVIYPPATAFNGCIQ